MTYECLEKLLDKKDDQMLRQCDLLRENRIAIQLECQQTGSVEPLLEVSRSGDPVA